MPEPTPRRAEDYVHQETFEQFRVEIRDSIGGLRADIHLLTQTARVPPTTMFAGVTVFLTITIMASSLVWLLIGGVRWDVTRVDESVHANRLFTVEMELASAREFGQIQSDNKWQTLMNAERHTDIIQRLIRVEQRMVNPRVAQ